MKTSRNAKSSGFLSEPASLASHFLLYWKLAEDGRRLLRVLFTFTLTPKVGPRWTSQGLWLLCYECVSTSWASLSSCIMCFNLCVLLKHWQTEASWVCTPFFFFFFSTSARLPSVCFACCKGCLSTTTWDKHCKTNFGGIFMADLQVRPVPGRFFECKIILQGKQLQTKQLLQALFDFPCVVVSHISSEDSDRQKMIQTGAFQGGSVRIQTWNQLPCSVKTKQDWTILM